MKALLFILFSGWLCSWAVAQGTRLIEKTIEVQVDEANPNLARKLLLEAATDKIARAQIKEIIGEAKYDRNLALINSKILKNSSRFVPVAKASDLVVAGDGYKMTVTLKISQDDLQNALLEHGLFYESDVAPVLLPVITLTDRTTSSSWSWWKDQSAAEGVRSISGLSLSKLSRELEIKLRQAFWKNNFYLLRPQAYHYFELASDADKIRMSSEFNAQIYLDGEMAVERNPKRSDSYVLSVHIIANQVQNGRAIGEVHRQYETDSGPIEHVVAAKIKETLDGVCVDLASQVLETWQKGALGANLFRLSIRGKIPMDQRESLKEELRNHAREIKNVHERLIAADELVLEVDSSLTPAEFASALPKINAGQYILVSDGASDNEVRYKATRTEAAK